MFVHMTYCKYSTRPSEQQGGGMLYNIILHACTCIILHACMYMSRKEPEKMNQPFSRLHRDLESSFLNCLIEPRVL